MPIMSRTLMSFAALCCMAAATTQAQEWPRFRGEQGAGTSETTGLPATWSESENIVWKLEMPGYGASSPILWGEKLFITCYTGYGQGGEDGEKADLHGQTLCINRHTGETIWDMSIPTFRGERQYEGFIREHGYSSATPATDGNHVVSFFGASGVVAYDMEGNELWRTSVGTKTHNFGSGTSPVIFGSLVIINASVESDALVALNLADGSEVWRIPRTDNTSFSSPVVAHIAGRDQMLISGADYVSSFDPRSGKLLWKVKGTSKATCGTIVWDGDIVYASGGYPETQTIAIRADGSGDVLWSNRENSYEQSMIASGGYLYTVNDRGIAFCWDGLTGEEKWKHRLGGPVSASPVLAGDLIYATNEKGTTFVFRANPEEFDLVAENQLGDETFATPTICGGRIYMRVASSAGGERVETLYCLDEK